MDVDFKLLRGFGYRQTHAITDIGECRVAFVTENIIYKIKKHRILFTNKNQRSGKINSTYLDSLFCRVYYTFLDGIGGLK